MIGNWREVGLLNDIQHECYEVNLEQYKEAYKIKHGEYPSRETTDKQNEILWAVTRKQAIEIIENELPKKRQWNFVALLGISGIASVSSLKLLFDTHKIGRECDQMINGVLHESICKSINYSVFYTSITVVVFTLLLTLAILIAAFLGTKK